MTRRMGKRLVAVSSYLVIRTYETSIEGVLLSDTVVSVSV
jgi:hypothetical protein